MADLPHSHVYKDPLTPVVMPSRASTLTVNCVPKREELPSLLTCRGSSSRSARSAFTLPEAKTTKTMTMTRTMSD